MSGDVVSFVNVTSVTREDSGVYRCEARNDLSTQSYEEQVFVTGPPYVKPMPNVTGLVGQTIVLYCPVTGYPIEKIFWKKGNFYTTAFFYINQFFVGQGGRELPSSERQRVYSNGTLEMRDANRELDQGQYLCGAANARGDQHTRHVHVQVLSK